MLLKKLYFLQFLKILFFAFNATKKQQQQQHIISLRYWFFFRSSSSSLFYAIINSLSFLFFLKKNKTKMHIHNNYKFNFYTLFSLLIFSSICLLCLSPTSWNLRIFFDDQIRIFAENVTVDSFDFEAWTCFIISSRSSLFSKNVPGPPNVSDRFIRIKMFILTVRNVGSCCY